MKKLLRHELKTELVRPFFQGTLDSANSLSVELLNDFKYDRGNFFTLLPEDANLANLYRFKYGNILPQNPIQYGPVGTLGNQYYSETPSIIDELAKMIGDFLHHNTDFFCIIDDVIRNFNDKIIQKSDEQFKSCIAYSDKEVYYLLNKQNAVSPLIVKCLERSIGFWHSLCVLSKTPLKAYIGKELKKPILTQICSNAQMIIIGAYDAEGYVIWERS